MTSPLLDSTHGRTTSGVACHHCLWAPHTVERHRAWHNITAIGHHTRSATSGVACHHRPWTALTVERRRAQHDIIAFGQHTRLNNIGRGMTSPPLDRTHCRTTSGVACHHRIWAAHTVEQRRVWHAIITFGMHKPLNDFGRGMKSPPLDCTEGRMTWDVA